MKKNQKNSITVHEYAAINRHVDEVAARNLELTRLKRTQVHRANVKNAGYLMAAIAVAALIMATAYWLYKAANAISPSHDHNEIVDGESYSNGDIVRDTEKIVIIEKPVVVPVEVEVEGEKIRNFTIFVEKSTVLDGIDEVVTGVTYISSDNKWPSYQWCYTTNPLNNVYATQIKLAEKKGRGGVDWQDISGDDAKQYGSTVENLRAAKQFCSFVFKPAQEGKQRITSVDQGKQTSSGSGFFIHKRGYLITNEHVIRNCSVVWIRRGGVDVLAEVIRRDAEQDLATLKVHIDDDANILSFAREVFSGQDVIAFGFPYGNALGDELKVTKGNVSAMSGLKGNSRHLQFTAPIQSGSSGGPLLNVSGAIVGMTTATLRGDEFQNINFAIKGAEIQSYLGKGGISFSSSDELDRGTSDVVKLANESTVPVLCY